MSIGDTLAEARRQAGLTVTQVSGQTRIRESIIRSVEAGDFSPCGGDFYARGHIRSMADVIGVDPVPLVREYDAEHGAPGAMRAAQIFEPATPIKIREPRPLHLGRVLAVVLLAAVGFGVYHLVATRGGHSSAAPPVTVRPVVTVTAQPKATVKLAPTGPAYPKGKAVITMAAKSDCWVGLTMVSTGKTHPYYVRAGQSMTWKEAHPVTMVIGNPAGVRLTVNGKAEQMNTVQVVTLSINPASASPVSVG